VQNATAPFTTGRESLSTLVCRVGGSSIWSRVGGSRFWLISWASY